MVSSEQGAGGPSGERDTSAGEPAWLELNSPVARRVVEAVMHAVPTDAHTIPPAQDSQCTQYQLRIHMLLRDSGLAQRIAAGPDALPWIYDHIPPWQRRIIQPRRPSTPEQMAVHVMRHLEWYLEPPRPAAINPWRRLTTFLTKLAAIVVCTALILWYGPGPPTSLIVLFFAAVLTGFPFKSLIYDLHEDDLHYDIRCAEFYCYLIDAYTDEGII